MYAQRELGEEYGLLKCITLMLEKTQHFRGMHYALLLVPCVACSSAEKVEIINSFEILDFLHSITTQNIVLFIVTALRITFSIPELRNSLNPFAVTANIRVGCIAVQDFNKNYIDQILVVGLKHPSGCIIIR